MSNGRKRFARMEILFPLFLLGLTTVYLAATFDIRTQFAAGGIVGPRTIPVLTAILMYFALGFVLFKELRKPAEEVTPVALLRPGLVILATAAYIFCFRPLGYPLATILYVAALFLIFRFETGRWLRFALYAALVTLAFYGLFAGVFGVRLPTMPGGFL